MRPGQRTEGAASLKVGYSMAVPPNLRGKVRELSSVLVDAANRGQGAATALMRKVMAEADLNHMALLVMPEPFDSEPMDKNALALWYGRLGFKVLQAKPMVMIRWTPGLRMTRTEMRKQRQAQTA